MSEEYIARSMNSAVLDAAAGATTAVIAAPGAGRALWIYGWVLGAGTAAGTYIWKSATTAKSGAITGGVNGGSVAIGKYPVFKCTENEALNITTVGLTADGVVSYRSVNA